MSAYDLECCQLDMGADTLRELQEEILLKPVGTSFYERFLRHLATTGVWLSPLYNGEEGEPAPPLTVAAATRTHRVNLTANVTQSRTALAILPNPKGPDSAEVTAAKLVLHNAREALNLQTTSLKQLRERGITKVAQLLGTSYGGLFPRAAVPGGGALSAPAYKAVCKTLLKIP